MTDQITATVAARVVNLIVTGAPDVRNRYGSGTIRPSEIDLTYRQGQPPRALLAGVWRREDGTLTDAPASQPYRIPVDQWPDWLADLARQYQHGPDACQFHSPTGAPCDCGHAGGADCHPKES